MAKMEDARRRGSRQAGGWASGIGRSGAGAERSHAPDSGVPPRLSSPESLTPNAADPGDPHADGSRQFAGRLTPTRAGRPWGSILLFLGPALGFYFAFIIYPVLVTFYNSVHTLRMDLGMTYEFVGLQHFREILSEDEVFWRAARNCHDLGCRGARRRHPAGARPGLHPAQQGALRPVLPHGVVHAVAHVLSRWSASSGCGSTTTTGAWRTWSCAPSASASTPRPGWPARRRPCPP